MWTIRRLLPIGLFVLAALVISTSVARSADGDPVAADPPIGGAESSGDAVVPTSDELEAMLQTIPELIKFAKYDEAIVSLGSIIGHSDDADLLRSAYLFLIKTYVQQSNYYRTQPGQTETSRLLHARAAEVTLECLQRKGLVDTEPDPPRDYPEEMLTVFDRVRRENFGDLHITELEPPEAEVELDGRRVKRYGSHELPYERNLTVGEHLVRITAEGYNAVSERIQISPGATLERPWVLRKGRGARWWLTRGGVTVGAAVLGALLIPGGSSSGGPEQLEPLAGPPDPPE